MWAWWILQNPLQAVECGIQILDCRRRSQNDADSMRNMASPDNKSVRRRDRDTVRRGCIDKIFAAPRVW